jgi:hypothetical protein
MTKDEIITLLEKEQSQNAVLNQISNPSAVAVMKHLNQVYAAVGEVLFNRLDLHQTEIEELVASARWATPEWYVQKAKEFQIGFELTTNDLTQYYYDNDAALLAGKTQAQIDASRVVKQAAVDFTGKRMILKIAGELNGNLSKLSDTVAESFRSYIEKIKRPGTPITIYNFDADLVAIEYDIYYRGYLKEADVKAAVETTMRSYLKSIVFNGIFNTAALTDALQQTVGVVDPFFVRATARRSFDATTKAVAVTQYYSSYAGYMKFESIKINMIRK